MQTVQNIPATMRMPMHYNGGKFTHDKIRWATDHARDCLIDKGDNDVTNNILRIFDCISEILASTFSKIDVRTNLLPKLINVLVDHEGLLPPPESTSSFHSIIHTVDKIGVGGIPHMWWIFKYERKMKTLKGMEKNNRYPISSIVKNYLISEMITQDITLSLKNTRSAVQLLRYTPKSTAGSVNNIFKALSTLRVVDDTVLSTYDFNNDDVNTIGADNITYNYHDSLMNFLTTHDIRGDIDDDNENTIKQLYTQNANDNHIDVDSGSEYNSSSDDDDDNSDDGGGIYYV
jgi:hypothetical protein